MITNDMNKIITTAHKLKELQFEVKDEMMAALLLSDLPDNYKPMIMGLESSSIELTAYAVKIKILQEVQVGNADSNLDHQAALYTKTRKTSFKDNKVKNCFVCDKPGHFAAKCKYKKKKESSKESSKDQTAFIVAKGGPKDTAWYIDSCTSSHMTNNAAWLKDAQQINTSVITMASYKHTLKKR